MKITTITCAFVAAGAIGFLGAPIASADGPTLTTLGSKGNLVDAAGNIIQAWTITNLKPSTDVIPHPVDGALWEATATDEAVAGGVTPIVSDLNARARDGQTYRALFGAATPQGVNPATLAQGEKTTGKVYFDVTGATPDSVVYNAGGQDILVWVQPPPAPPRKGGSRSTPAGSTPAAATETPAPGAPLVDGAQPGTSPAAVPAGSAGTPLPAGSAGTPLPEGSAGTPVPAPAAGPAAVPAGSAGTPVEPAPAPMPAAVGSQGTPMVAPSPAAAPVPAPLTPAPVPVTP